eukprot:TRINITY_DN1035_c0_g1_i1.p1 TRINITY_DN1035_c0_g1~~TRINITY_DN1035_c0_g1_i1.p1  ORF type:complete len:806 (+),score=181.74 TRINITY_DN1035_c0_g1_i1:777-3194(+)
MWMWVMRRKQSFLLQAHLIAGHVLRLPPPGGHSIMADEDGGCMRCCPSPSLPNARTTYASDPRMLPDTGLGGDHPALENATRRTHMVDCIALGMYMLLIFASLGVGIYGFAHGEPARLTHGRDYRGVLCGHGEKPAGWDSALYSYASLRAFKFQSLQWSKNVYTWYPIPYEGHDTFDPGLGWDIGAFSHHRAFRHGVCVQTCPAFPTPVVIVPAGNATNITTPAPTPAPPTEPPTPAPTQEGDPEKRREYVDRIVGNFEPGGALGAVWTYGNATLAELDGGAVVDDYYQVWYESTSVMRRCIPIAGSLPNVTGDAEYDDLMAEATLLSRFLHRAFAELEAYEPTIYFASAVAIMTSLVLVVLANILTQAFLYAVWAGAAITPGIAGWLSVRRGLRFGDDGVPHGSDEAFYFLAAAVLWCTALCFAGLGAWLLRKRDKELRRYIREAAQVFRVDPTALMVPIICTAALLAAGGFFYNACVYVYTLEDAEGMHVSAGEARDAAKQNLVFLLILAWGLTTCVIQAFCYFAFAALSVQYYYSHHHDGNKGVVPCCGWLTSAWWGIRYHFGTFVLASLFFTFVPFVRGVVTVALLALGATGKQHSKDAEEEHTACVISMLRWLETRLQYPSKAGLILVAIDGQDFFTACSTAADVLRGAFVFRGVASALTDSLFFALKCAITGLTLCWAYWMQQEDTLEGADDGVVGLIICAVYAYSIASMFAYLLEAPIDTLIVLMFHEAQKPRDPNDYFCPGPLFRLVTGMKKLTGADDFKDRLDKYRAMSGARVYDFDVEMVDDDKPASVSIASASQ